MPIEPHGGELIDRVKRGKEREKLLEEADELASKALNPREISDLYLIAVGGFSPLTGFMGGEDYESVLENTTLANDLPWSIPITLSLASEEAEHIGEGDRIALRDQEGGLLAIMDVRDKYDFDKKREASIVYRTTEEAHPGVAKLYETGDVLIGGPIHYLVEKHESEFPKYDRTPAEVRAIFRERGWKSVVAFQTRNPVHRAHEYLQKCAMEIVDGLLLHPLVGETKDDDIPADVRMRCYEVLLEKYYPADRTLLSILPAAMRYAGPKEAIFHSIMRKNYGCTHFIVGRDHAGVGDYYGTYDAHYIFDEVDMTKLKIQPLFFDHAFYCKSCPQMVSTKTCPHEKSQHVFLSGTKVRELLSKGESLPAEFTRPEVADVLKKAYQG